ncbi:VOC family protein [Mucilaginibacter sp. BJC16-A38]|uniref:VOC family protein n=1 Tax=Mucilaginibacter phenanthrenivorans TaxID=1234842 RepID=UPI00215801E9|nr:VOC family protein [Mucilaginibacter phenanthrenivorans]MCR8559887.1 VOC family protein [Mucilaginibacter phenanthrenivorans]
MKKQTLLILALLLITKIGLAQKPYAAFNHVSLYVSDVDKSAAFYRKLFHLDTTKIPVAGQRVKWLKMGKYMQLHLIESKKDQLTVAQNNHIAFSVQSLADFIQVLKKENIKFGGAEDNDWSFVERADGVKQIYFKDPDGYRVEVNDAAY